MSMTTIKTRSIKNPDIIYDFKYTDEFYTELVKIFSDDIVKATLEKVVYDMTIAKDAERNSNES